MKSRERQRANRKLKEEMLSIRDHCGVKDPTPYEAVKKIINEMKRNKGRRGKYGVHTDAIGI